MSYTITIKIARMGQLYYRKDGSIDGSAAGHVWYQIESLPEYRRDFILSHATSVDSSNRS